MDVGMGSKFIQTIPHLHPRITFLLTTASPDDNYILVGCMSMGYVNIAHLAIFPMPTRP